MTPPADQPRVRLIHRLTCPTLTARHLAAVNAGQHTMAWRLPDGREVLTVPGLLSLWYPNGRATVEVTYPSDVSPREMVRRIDAGEMQV